MSPFFNPFLRQSKALAAVSEAQNVLRLAVDKGSSSPASRSSSPTTGEETYKHDSAVVMWSKGQKNFDIRPHDPNLLSNLSNPRPALMVQSSPFLTLPAELRNQIYELVFQPSDHTSSGALIPSSDSIRNLGLLFTCRQVYTEAIALAYAVTFSVTNRWHAADLKGMHLQLEQLSCALGPRGHEAAPESRYSGPYPDAMTQGRAMLEVRKVEFAGHLRRPYCLPGTESREFLDAARDYMKFVYTVVALWKGVSRIVIVTERSTFEFARMLRHGFEIDYELGSPVLEDHELICDEDFHERCEREGGKWRPVDDGCDGLEAVFWLVRKKEDGEKGDRVERRVEIRCKESSDTLWGRASFARKKSLF